LNSGGRRFLSGKKAFIVGLATDRSIAWGISQAMKREGATLAFSYQNDRIKERVIELAGELGSKLVMPMDVGIDGEIDAAFARLRSEWSALDVLVHSVAFAPRSSARRLSKSRAGPSVSRTISQATADSSARAGLPLMEGRQVPARCLSRRPSIPSYNVMGLAKASPEANVTFWPPTSRAVSRQCDLSGPHQDARRRDIPSLRKMLLLSGAAQAQCATEDVGNAAAFLCSDLAPGSPAKCSTSTRAIAVGMLPEWRGHCDEARAGSFARSEDRTFARRRNPAPVT
jgi:enoyl-[acyl-carrier protein] reductase I